MRKFSKQTYDATLVQARRLEDFGGCAMVYEQPKEECLGDGFKGKPAFTNQKDYAELLHKLRKNYIEKVVVILPPTNVCPETKRRRFAYISRGLKVVSVCATGGRYLPTLPLSLLILFLLCLFFLVVEPSQIGGLCRRRIGQVGGAVLEKGCPRRVVGG